MLICKEWLNIILSNKCPGINLNSTLFFDSQWLYYNKKKAGPTLLSVQKKQHYSLM